MTKLLTTRGRVRRTTASIHKYDQEEYALVSFPQSNKHSVLPVSHIDIDPLDQRNGSIDRYGSRKNLRIIATGKHIDRSESSLFFPGSEEQIKERALRYGTSAGSEELELFHHHDDSEDDEYSIGSANRTSKRSQGRKRNKSHIETIANHPVNKISKQYNSKYMRLSKSMFDFFRRSMPVLI